MPRHQDGDHHIENEEEQKNSPRDVKDDVSWTIGKPLFIFLFILFNNTVL